MIAQRLPDLFHLQEGYIRLLDRGTFDSAHVPLFEDGAIEVIAAQLALGNAAAVVPLLMGGALADSLGIRPVLGLLGLLAVGAGAAGLRYVRG